MYLQNQSMCMYIVEELNSSTVGVRSRKLSNVGQSLDGCPKVYYHEHRASHVKPSVPAVFAVASTH
jgi:hypothetical protein